MRRVFFFFFPLYYYLWLWWIWLVASGDDGGWMWYGWMDVVAGSVGLRKREIEEKETEREEE